jgi:glycine cleavage system aminomethyltransferase T
MGETLYIPSAGKTHTAKVVKPMFYDAEGSRLNG